jgi:Tfp pilus assembly protein PilF
MKAELEKAVELQPKHFPSRLALTRVLLQDRDMKAVQNNLKVLKELAPDQVDVVALEVSAARQKGDTQEALRIAESYYNKSPGTASMLMLAAQMSVAGDKAGAYTLQKQWLEKHPDDLPARLALANMYTLDTKNEEAIEEYRTVLRNDEENLIALNNLAWFLQDTKPQEALGYAKRANEIRPESVDMMDTLAVVMFKNGQAREAQRIMDRVLKLAPQNLTMRYHSAMIDAAAGDISTAEMKLMKLKEEDKKFPEKKEAMKLLQELQSGR